MMLLLAAEKTGEESLNWPGAIVIVAAIAGVCFFLWLMWKD